MTLLITLIFLTDVSFIIPNEYPFRPCGKIVLVAIQDEGSNHVKSALDALKILGATEPVLPDCRGRRKSSSTAWSRNSLYFLLVFPSSRRTTVVGDHFRGVAKLHVLFRRLSSRIRLRFVPGTGIIECHKESFVRKKRTYYILSQLRCV